MNISISVDCARQNISSINETSITENTKTIKSLKRIQYLNLKLK